MVHPQLTLPLDTAPARSFASFHVDEANAVAHRILSGFVEGATAERQIFLWGESGAGKSHLLSAACQRVAEDGYRVAYVPAALAAHPDALDGLEHCELVCVDDIDELDSSAESSLCRCIERCRAAGTMLLFAARKPPEQLALARPELLAMLDLGPRYRVDGLSGEALRTAVHREAEQRSLALGDDIVDYLLKRFPPTMAALRPVIDRLDRAALTEKRRVTLALVKRTVGASVPTD